MQDRTKQTTLAGFFGKPKAGAAPSRTPSSSAILPPVPRSQPLPPVKGDSSSQTAIEPTSPASSSTLKTPSSLAESPHPKKEKERKRAGSPLKQSFTIEDDGSLSPAPVDVDMEDVKESVEDSIEASGEGRRAKRKVVYAESGGSDSDDDVPLQRGAKGEPKTTT